MRREHDMSRTLRRWPKYFAVSNGSDIELLGGLSLSFRSLKSAKSWQTISLYRSAASLARKPCRFTTPNACFACVYLISLLVPESLRGLDSALQEPCHQTFYPCWWAILQAGVVSWPGVLGRVPR
jgi:hypothetical protein